jgi:glycosyltransferase involved in cell wall biosynthesis
LTKEAVMLQRLLVVVISWNRPAFLRKTLTSLFAATTRELTDIVIVDNGSDQETKDIIQGEPRLMTYRLLDRNYGLNVALEAAVPRQDPRYSYILVSDADMYYREPIEAFCRFLQHPAIEAVSLHHSPEHPVAEMLAWGGNDIMIKNTERGCSFGWRRALPEITPRFHDKLSES